MSKLTDIPIVVDSGQKYKTLHGVIAIKDGVKESDVTYERLPKPAWLRMVTTTSPEYNFVKSQVKAHRLSTVCE